jgi:hypothetical protein
MFSSASSTMTYLTASVAPSVAVRWRGLGARWTPSGLPTTSITITCSTTPTASSPLLTHRDLHHCPLHRPQMERHVDASPTTHVAPLGYCSLWPSYVSTHEVKHFRVVGTVPPLGPLRAPCDHDLSCLLSLCSLMLNIINVEAPLQLHVEKVFAN